MRSNTPRRHASSQVRTTRPATGSANRVWAMGFTSDALSDGCYLESYLAWSCTAILGSPALLMTFGRRRASPYHLNPSDTTSLWSLVLLPLELLGASEGSCLVRACLDVENLTVHLATTAPTAACPLCGSDTRRVHSRYTRRLDDLPCLGRSVRSRSRSVGSFAHSPTCPRRIFAERLPGFAAPWARTHRTAPARTANIGSSLGGEAGCRLAARWRSPPAPIRCFGGSIGLKNEPVWPPRVVGIDDWAWRKGQRYGTIVVDLERGDVIDLLPDRDAETVAAWLKAHPGSRWSAGTARRPTPRRRRKRLPGRAGRRIAGTC